MTTTNLYEFLKSDSQESIANQALLTQNTGHLTSFNFGLNTYVKYKHKNSHEMYNHNKKSEKLYAKPLS